MLAGSFRPLCQQPSYFLQLFSCFCNPPALLFSLSLIRHPTLANAQHARAKLRRQCLCSLGAWCTTGPGATLATRPRLMQSEAMTTLSRDMFERIWGTMLAGHTTTHANTLSGGRRLCNWASVLLCALLSSEPAIPCHTSPVLHAPLGSNSLVGQITHVFSSAPGPTQSSAVRVVRQQAVRAMVVEQLQWKCQRAEDENDTHTADFIQLWFSNGTDPCRFQTTKNHVKSGN